MGIFGQDDCACNPYEVSTAEKSDGSFSPYIEITLSGY